MVIKRDGKEYELTQAEMWDAHDAVRHDVWQGECEDGFARIYNIYSNDESISFKEFTDSEEYKEMLEEATMRCVEREQELYCTPSEAEDICYEVAEEYDMGKLCGFEM